MSDLRLVEHPGEESLHAWRFLILLPLYPLADPRWKQDFCAR